MNEWQPFETTMETLPERTKTRTNYRQRNLRSEVLVPLVWTLIGAAFVALAGYLLVQSTWVLVSGFRPHHSVTGIVWTAVTAAVMFGLAAGKASTGARLGNPVLRTEGRVTLIDGFLAVAVLAGLVLNAAWGWWWADPLAGYVLVYYAVREAWLIVRGRH